MSPVTIVGMVIGALASLTALGIFVSKREFPAGGVGVLGIGFVLIGMSQWTSVKLDAGGVSIEAVQNLQNQVQATAGSAASVAEEAKKTAAAVDITRQQLTNLTTQLASNRSLPPESASSIRAKIAAAPRTDTSQLVSATVQLRNVHKIQKRAP